MTLFIIYGYIRFSGVKLLLFAVMARDIIYVKQHNVLFHQVADDVVGGENTFLGESEVSILDV